MYLEELSTVNFRNLQNQTVKFSQGINVFWGDNAQGKTNLLEAIYLLASAKSFRSRETRELISWGQDEARVRGKSGSFDIELTITSQSKALTINKQERKLTDIIGSFVGVLFTPNDVALVSGAPLERRRFLDQLLSYLDREYLLQLVSLNKVIRSRNQLLYRLQFNSSDQLDVWDDQLAKLAAFIWKRRAEAIDDLNNKLAKLGEQLLGSNLALEYHLPYAKDSLEEDYRRRLEENRIDDLQRKQTSFGPHRDNFKIIVEEVAGEKIVSKDLGIYGSRGEQRSASLALKLAEIKLLEEKRDLKPVLLLDEVLSELDQNHRKLLLDQVGKGQTFITSTNLDSVTQLLSGKLASYQVDSGKVKAEK